MAVRYSAVDRICLMGLLARGWPVVRQMQVERTIQVIAGSTQVKA
jgi:hypothetical protein